MKTKDIWYWSGRADAIYTIVQFGNGYIETVSSIKRSDLIFMTDVKDSEKELPAFVRGNCLYIGLAQDPFK